MSLLAKDFLSVDFSHPRASVDLGDLSGQAGNAIIVNGTSCEQLKSRDFTLEASELSYLLYNRMPSYEQSFNKISFFLNIAPAPIHPLQLIDLSKPSVNLNGDTLQFCVDAKEFNKALQEHQQYISNVHLIQNITEKSANEEVKKSIEQNTPLTAVSQLNNLNRHSLYYCSSDLLVEYVKFILSFDKKEAKDIIKNTLFKKDIGGGTAMISRLSDCANRRDFLEYRDNITAFLTILALVDEQDIKSEDWLKRSVATEILESFSYLLNFLCQRSDTKYGIVWGILKDQSIQEGLKDANSKINNYLKDFKDKAQVEETLSCIYRSQLLLSTIKDSFGECFLNEKSTNTAKSMTTAEDSILSLQRLAKFFTANHSLNDLVRTQFESYMLGCSFSKAGAKNGSGFKI